jgi:hypothetical protein
MVQGEVVASIPGRSGLVTYGPYLRLLPGTYDFEMHITPRESYVGEELGEWDVFTASDQKVHHRGPIVGSSQSTQIQRGSFSVSRQTKNLLWEVRTFSQGNARFTVDGLKISRR